MTRMTGITRVTGIIRMTGMTREAGMTQVQTLTIRDCKGPQTNMLKNIGSIKT